MPQDDSSIKSRLKSKSWYYWETAVLFLALSAFATPYIYEKTYVGSAREAFLQWIVEHDWRAMKPRYTKLVMIGDDEYWKGELDGRRPIKRDYIGKLVKALDEANVSVIAIDFDLRTPVSSSPSIPEEYKAETKAFVEAILDAAKHRKIVLPKTIWWDDKGNYILEPDIYESYGVCAHLDDQGNWKHDSQPELPISDTAAKNITCGYIALPPDKLQIPGSLRLADGRSLDSFALAIAKASDPQTNTIQDPTLGSYIPVSRFSLRTLVAKDVLERDDARATLAHTIAIVSGVWSSLGFQRGFPTDLHPTPLGPLGGALIHANFVESLLDGRTYTPMPGYFVHALEGLIGLLAILTFAISPGFFVKVAAAVVLSAALLILEYLSVSLAGVFLDAGILLLGVWLHSLAEPLML